MEKNIIYPRVLHTAALLRPTSGMCTQMDWELDAAKALGIEWQVKMYCPKNSPGIFGVMYYDSKVDANHLTNPLAKLLGWLKLRYNYHRWLKKQEENTDIFLLRYYVHDPFQYWFVWRCKKQIYLVHHTLEVPELSLSGGFYGWLRSSIESFVGKKTIRFASGVIGVTKEIVDYELSRAKSPEKISYVYPNGIFYKEQILQDRRGYIPEFLFVANFSPWHGLDRLLDAVGRSDEKFIIHLVGKVPDELMYKVSDPRIQVHGHLDNKQISTLSEQCWVGLASFALDRNNMKQACPLKTREYLMLGLPVCGDYEDAFVPGFPYYNKSTEMLRDIIDFATRLRLCDKKEISDFSMQFICKKKLLGDMYNHLSRNFSRGNLR